MSYLVETPEDRLSRDEAHLKCMKVTYTVILYIVKNAYLRFKRSKNVNNFARIQD